MRGRRSTIVAAALALLVVAGMVWLVRPGGSGVSLDPRGTGPTGTAAMLRMVERLGADVEITDAPPAAGEAGTIVVLADRLDDDTRDAVAARVRDGARLVLFDPGSPLAPAPVSQELVTDTFGVLGREPACGLLDGVADRVESARWVVFGDAAGVTDRCFPVGDGEGLVVAEVGAGEVLATGAVDALVNESITEADHARLAAALLVPEGTGRVTVVWDARIGQGDTALLDLLPGGVRRALWLLAGAAAVYALVRARRLGPPVAERLPVRVPASELALAIGDLLGRHGHRDAAAARLRADLRVEVARALHVPVDTPPDVLVELLAERGGHDLDQAGLRAALLDGPVPDDDTLVAVASALARVRQRVRRPAGSAGGGAPPL